MKTKLIIVVVVIVLLLGAGYLYTQNSKKAAIKEAEKAGLSPLGPAEALPGSEANNQGRTISKNEVSLTGKGFEPATITIKVGEAVTWTNNGGTAGNVSSDPHPIHTDYPMLNNVGNLINGERKSFTFSTAGTYKYHDHNNPDFKGTVIVE